MGIVSKGFRFWRRHQIGKRILGKELTSEQLEIEVTEETQVFKGKLTYSGIAVLALSWALERFGVPVAPEEAEGIIASVTALVGGLAAIYGRYRATKDAT